MIVKTNLYGLNSLSFIGQSNKKKDHRQSYENKNITFYHVKNHNNQRMQLQGSRQVTLSTASNEVGGKEGGGEVQVSASCACACCKMAPFPRSLLARDTEVCPQNLVVYLKILKQTRLVYVVSKLRIPLVTSEIIFSKCHRKIINYRIELSNPNRLFFYIFYNIQK